MTPTRRPPELFDAASRRSDEGSDTIHSAAEAAATAEPAAPTKTDD